MKTIRRQCLGLLLLTTAAMFAIPVHAYNPPVYVCEYWGAWQPVQPPTITNSILDQPAEPVECGQIVTVSAYFQVNPGVKHHQWMCDSHYEDALWGGYLSKVSWTATGGVTPNSGVLFDDYFPHLTNYTATVTFTVPSQSGGIEIFAEGIATDPVGSVDGSSVWIPFTVPGKPPEITMQPVNHTTTVGGSATFSVTVNSCSYPPVSYQWWSKNQIADATSDTLSLANVQLSDAGYYYVLVSNPYGSVSSMPAVLTVLVPPEITAQPAAQTVCAGATVHFRVAATGFPLSYHWKKNEVNLSDGGNVSGSTTPTLTLANVSSGDTANYTVEVSNGNQTVTSTPAALAISATCTAPTIITQPQSQTAAAGAIVSFTVTATGGLPLSYQWQKNGVNLIDGGEIFGATTPTLTLQGITPADAGSYTVTVNNGGGSATSSAATLSVSGSCGVTFTQQPADWFADIGGTATFNVTVQESGLTYQWLKDAVNLADGGNISGVHTPTLTLNSISPADVGRYTVDVSNGSCSVVSQPAALIVNGFKVRITEPKDNAILP